MRHARPLLILLLGLLPMAARAQGLWLEARVLTPVRVALPEPLEVGRNHPLVVLLHGRGGSGEAMLDLRPRLGSSAFIFAVPQGPYPLGGGFSWFPPGDEPQLWPFADAQAVDLVERLIRTLKQRHPCGGVYLLGHSQGAAVAYLAAARLRKDVAGVLVFGAGRLGPLLTGDERAALKGLPQFLAHGRQDRLIPFADLPARLDEWKAAGVPTTFAPYAGGHDLSAAPLAEAAAWILKQEQAKAPVAP